jgi:polyribonucleotide nucleotidyltransferase
MKLNRKIYTTELNSQPLSLEISELAGKANAAVLGRHGDTAILATVVMGDREVGTDYFPLTVDYEERFYAAGKIMGSRFIRREGRPSDEATLSARLVDRTIRPLFDQRLRYEVQVTITVLAYDGKTDPDAVVLLAVSTALGISNIPWDGPAAGVKLDKAFFAGPEDSINMIEFEGDELTEEELIKLFEISQKEIKRLVEFQKPIIQELGREKINIQFTEPDLKLKTAVQNFVKDKLEEAVKNKTLGDLKFLLLDHLRATGESEEFFGAVDRLFEETIDCYVHTQIFENEKRPDGRKLDEIRPLYAEVGLFKRTHGSGLFIRGETQILAVTTLAPPSAEQLIETVEFSGHKRFLLHYNFPSFSSGEVGRSRSPGRREIGHGTLAAKALSALIPPKEDFPYTIRVVAETLSSNGSTSMASTCAASLSLMDAGVPLKKHVAGIAIGLVIDRSDKSNWSNRTYKLLTDIQGPEDHHGDMDFKVAGTADGVTAIQMDVKVKGVTLEIFKGALEQGRKARLEILEVMNKTLSAPRPHVSPYAPTILTLTIPKEKIGELIGPGGRNINGIIAASLNQVTIDIEEDGKVYVAGLDSELVKRAYETVKDSMREFQVGEAVEGKVVKLLEFGAIVDLGGGKDGMVHVSELKNGYVKKVEDVVKVGETVKAKVIRIDPDGRIGLSVKALNNL